MAVPLCKEQTKQKASQSCARASLSTTPGCLFIPGRVEGKQVKFLVDTGCSHSLLSKVVFDRLPSKLRANLQPRDTTAALADGSGLHIYGSVTLSGWLRNVPFQEEFLVGRISD